MVLKIFGYNKRSTKREHSRIACEITSAVMTLPIYFFSLETEGLLDSG